MTHRVYLRWNIAYDFKIKFINLNTGKVITIKDFFRKSSIQQEAVNNFIEYKTYELVDGERPDVVAAKLYGDSDLHWTFFLVNGTENYYD